MQIDTTLLESSTVAAQNQVRGKSLGPGTPLPEIYPKNKNSQKLYAKVYSIIKTTQKGDTHIHTKNLNVQGQGMVK